MVNDTRPTTPNGFGPGAAVGENDVSPLQQQVLPA